MDAVSATFHTAQAEIEWDTTRKSSMKWTNETGDIYYRRAGKDIEMMADVKMAGISNEAGAEIGAVQRRQDSHVPAQDSNR